MRRDGVSAYSRLGRLFFLLTRNTLSERPIQEYMASMQRSYDLDDARHNSTFSPELLERIKGARREKIRNKTRERERMRSGEVLLKTLKRRRTGLPAHLEATLTPSQKLQDRIRRERSLRGVRQNLDDGYRIGEERSVKEDELKAKTRVSITDTECVL